MYWLFLTGLVVDEVKDKRDRTSIARVIRTAVMSKQYGLEDFLAGLVADACSQCCSSLVIDLQ